MASRTNRTPVKKIRRGKAKEWKEKFLQALADTGNVRASCHIAVVSWDTVYAHRHKYPEFAEAWDQALEQSTDLLEIEARRRAMKEKSDVLMIFLLKANRPEKYREKIEQKHVGVVEREIRYVNDWRNPEERDTRDR